VIEQQWNKIMFQLLIKEERPVCGVTNAITVPSESLLEIKGGSLGAYYYLFLDP